MIKIHHTHKLLQLFLLDCYGSLYITATLAGFGLIMANEMQYLRKLISVQPNLYLLGFNNKLLSVNHLSQGVQVYIMFFLR